MSETRTVEVSFQALGRFYAKGSEIPADDPAVAKFPHLFTKAASAVRTTAAVPGPVVDPDGVTAARPPSNASKGEWRAYVRALGGNPGDETKAELVDLAGELESK